MAVLSLSFFVPSQHRLNVPLPTISSFLLRNMMLLSLLYPFSNVLRAVCWMHCSGWKYVFVWCLRHLTRKHHPRGSSHSYRSAFQTLFAEMGFADIVLRVSNFLEKVRLLLLSESDLLVYRIRPVPKAGRHGRTNVLGVRVA